LSRTLGCFQISGWPVKKVIVQDIQRTIEDDQVMLSARVDIQGWKIPDRPDPPERIFLQFPRPFENMIAQNGDAFVACFLMQCMAGGSDLHIEAPVSRTLLDNLHAMQEIWHSWDSKAYKRIAISADSVDTPDLHPDKTAALYSLGVDSFYTLAKNRKIPPACGAPEAPPIDYLIHLRGFEHRLGEDKTDHEQIMDLISQVSNRTDCVPIFGRTNFREFNSLSWGVGHGGAAAAVGLALGASLKTVLIASNNSYVQLGTEAGTHPLIDPLWSTQTTRFVHDGAERSRQAKVEALVEHMPESLQFLHVCWNNTDARLNCGYCIKCMDTMLTLDVLGKLGQAITFPDQLPENFIRNMLTFPRVGVTSLRINLRMAEERNGHRYSRVLERVARARRKDQYLAEMYPRWDRLTRRWRNLWRRIWY